jgi:acetylornithine/succinyldiaminopimelate/putrescine aminotransferase/predicted amino acid dehydrogenase
LASLRKQGVELWTDGDQLRYSAPKGVLTPALRSELLERKGELLTVLRSKPKYYGNKRRRFHLDPTILANSHPYIRHVNPYLGYLLSQLNLDKQFVRGEGCYLYDHQGERYLDFIAQYGALPFGYNPPDIWRAIEHVRKNQLPSFVQPSVLTAAGELAQRLLQVAPPGLRYVTFANSGAEAVEIAIKLCRSATGRLGILATQNSFHGKTLGAVSATGKRIYQEAFGAPVHGFDHTPFGDIKALQRALTEKKGYYAAFIVEPIQGEGGIVEPPGGYLAQVREVCQKTGTLLVVDEVQTGLGRTGRLFACDHEGVTPDVMTLAKALGGGLMPVGACLCKEEVYNEEFALRHSSTFAGNTLACQAGLATVELLEKDDQRIVRQVAENGMLLKQELLSLQKKHPELIKSVRGKGYMLGVQLDLDSYLCRQGLLGYLVEQELFMYLIASYLLNVEKIRMAPTASAVDVLRIEPPLVAGWNECRVFVEALERTLNVLESGNTARLMGHLIRADVDEGSLVVKQEKSQKPVNDGRERSLPQVSKKDGRFAFLLHLNDISDYVSLDPSLRLFSEEQLIQLRKRGVGLLGPSPISEVLVESRTGQRAYGEFIILPYTASELLEMSYEQALSEITFAVEVARKRGAAIVGLGGFTSVATQGGLSLREEGLSPLTTGNSYTAAAARKAVEMACKSHDRNLSMSSLAVVGAAGAVGQATSVLLSASVSRIILLGNPRYPERSRARLRDVAGSMLHHLWRLHGDGKEFPQGTLGSCLVSMRSQIPQDPAPSDLIRLAEEIDKRFGVLTITTDINRFLHEADVVITATSAVESLIRTEHLKQNAIVCELSLPFNVSKEVRKLRSDVLFIAGGLVRVPGEPDLGLDLGHERGIVFACMAETMLLALEHSYQDTSLGVKLDLQTIQHLEALGEKHGFAVVY